MPSQLRVVLVRLCECEGNLTEWIAMHGDLTEVGKRQAKATKRRLAAFGVKAWACPDNSACLQTASILSHGARVRVMKAFAEPPYPRWEKQTFAQVAKQWPKEWNRYWNPRPGDACRVVVPGGESFRTTFERAKKGIELLYRKHRTGNAVAAVTHGEVIRLLTVGLLGAPLECLFRLRGRNGAVTVFDYDGSRAVFECINDTSHLCDLDTKDLSDYLLRRQ